MFTLINTFDRYIYVSIGAVFTLQIKVTNTRDKFVKKYQDAVFTLQVEVITPRFYLKVIGEWFPLTLMLHSEHEIVVTSTLFLSKV